MANYYDAYDDGHTDGAKDGLKSGYSRGYAAGYAAGYEAGGGGSGGGSGSTDPTVILQGPADSMTMIEDASVIRGDNVRVLRPQAQVSGPADHYSGGFASLAFNVPKVTLQFPSLTEIAEGAFSNVSSIGSSSIAVDLDAPKLQDIGSCAFFSDPDNMHPIKVTAELPSATDIHSRAFASNNANEHAAAQLSFPNMSPIWACIPAVSGTRDDSTPYHYPAQKIPMVPFTVYDDSGQSFRTPSSGAGYNSSDDFYWNLSGSSGVDVSNRITWSGNVNGSGFVYSLAEPAASPFSRGFCANAHLVLPECPVRAVVALDEYTQNVLQASGTPVFGGVLGLAPGSTITCSDGVYTVPSTH